MQQKAQDDMQSYRQFAEDAMDRDLEHKLDAKIALDAAALDDKAAFNEAQLYAKMNQPRTGQ